MARNKFDVDERLETPFDFRHLKRVGVYIGKHKWKMLLALLMGFIVDSPALGVGYAVAMMFVYYVYVFWFCNFGSKIGLSK